MKKSYWQIPQVCYNTEAVRTANQIWGYSSAGRALEWHSRGQRFDPAYLHQKLERVKKNLGIIWFQGFFFFKSEKFVEFAKGTCALDYWWKFWKSRGQVRWGKSGWIFPRGTRGFLQTASTAALVAPNPFPCRQYSVSSFSANSLSFTANRSIPFRIP